MKKMKKILSILMMIALVLTSTAPIFAAGVDPANLTGKDVTGQEKIEGIGNQIITIVSIVGSVVSVVVLIVLGIKYMMGSAEERAEYKKTLLPYIIGAVLVFAASAIAGVIFGFSTNITAG